MTFGELKASVEDWMKESVEDSLNSDACNDAVESLAMSVIQFRLGQFMGGSANQQNPVNLSIASGIERLQITTVADPTVALVVGNQAGGGLPGAGLVFAYSYVTESGSETTIGPTTNFNRAPNN